MTKQVCGPLSDNTGEGLKIRFNADLPSLAEVQTSVAGMPPKPFRLLSLPFYLIGQVRRLCTETLHHTR